MTDRIFRHRSGRVIASARLVLASVFLLALWYDPGQPGLHPENAYLLLTAYAVWAAMLLGLTWRNWWLDYRLAGPGHLIDIAAFGAVVYFTEGYTSPFYTFFVFLLLSAAIRWSWRETALTAALVLLLFAGAGTAALIVGGEAIDLQRLMVRSSYLVVLSLVFVWFAVNQRGAAPPPAAREPGRPATTDAPPVRQAIGLAADRLAADRILFAWSHREEPWVHFSELAGGELRDERVGPDRQHELFCGSSGNRPFLFDRRHQRGLCRHQAGAPQLRQFRVTVEPHLAERFALDQGLSIPIRAEDYSGELVALGIDGMCSDDLEEAEAIAAQVVALFDQSSHVAVSEEAAVTRARMALARDLHDSVVQSLAGASFRLEALKSWIRDGGDPAAEIDSVKEDLAAEQRNVRAFIAGLRSGRGPARTKDLRRGLPALCEQLTRHWNLACSLLLSDEPVEGPGWMEHELHQIIREAAANAARHGKASALEIGILARDGALSLSIADDGKGLPALAEAGGGPDGTGTAPWSLNERIHGLGGTLTLVPARTGCRLEIRLPMSDGP